jgi:acetoacetate decarboxylase
MVLKVNVGAIWLTQEGDFRDIFRAADQSFLLDRDGTPIVYACRHTAEGDVITATLHYGQALCALGTFGYKHRAADKDAVLKSRRKPNFLLKIIPHVDGTPRICELVRYYLEDIVLKEAWNTPAELQLFRHVIADVARLPVLEIVSGQHLVADLTLALGQVAFDYLAEDNGRVAARHAKSQRELANVEG